jgi:hypothetical protein
LAEKESTATMLQASFIKNGDGDFLVKTAAIPYPGTAATPVKIDAASTAFSGPNAESGFGIGAVAAPGAGATIASHTPPAGNAGKLHRIEVVTWLAVGAPAAAEDNNMAFKFGGTVISNLPVARALNVPIKTEFYFNAAAGTAFSIVAVAAATAGVTYCASINATKVVS